MSEEKEISDFFEALDGLKAVLPIIDDFKDDYLKLKEKNFKLNEQNSKLNEQNSKLNEQNLKLNEQNSKLKELHSKLKEQNSKLEGENKKFKEDNNNMKMELDNVSNELKKVSKEFEHLTKEKGEKIKIREILALSMTLLTEVFGAQPHSKILYLLHGKSSEMHRDTLTKSSGISPAVIRKSLADLNAAKLVDYNVESGIVKLLKRIY